MPNSTIKMGDLVEIDLNTAWGSTTEKDVFLVDEIDPSNSIMFLLPIVTDNYWSLDGRGRAPFRYPPVPWIKKLEYPDVE